MSTWTTPATWANGAVTAATMNTEIRDHLNFLKGALDILTNSTTADTGATSVIDLALSAVPLAAFSARRSGDANPRFYIDRNGAMVWSGAANERDVVLARSAAGRLLMQTLVGANPSLGIELATSPGATNAVFAWASGDTQPRVALGTNAGHKGEIRFGPGGSTAADLYLTRDQAGRLLATASSGGARIGAELDATGTQTNSIFAWVSGDSQPRATIGIYSTGAGMLALGGGGATAPDAVMIRVASGFETQDTFIRAIRGTTGQGSFVGRVSGDGTDQFTLFARGHGAFGDGVSTLVKAGAIVDGDFRATPPSGTIAVDTTNSRLYVRVGGTWKSVVVA